MLRSLVILAAASAAHGQTFDLSHYRLTQSIPLPSSPLFEASALTFNWDTGRLFVLPDSTTGIFELSTSGAILSQMSLSGFEDPEGITYLGSGAFALAEERQQRIYRFTYTPGGILIRSQLQSAPLGSPTGNDGIEGVSFEPATGFTFAVKEKNPMRILRATIDFPAGSASFIDLFSPAGLGVTDLADIAVLSTLPSLTGTSDQDNLLLLSQESARVLEVTRGGTIQSFLSLSGLSTNAEGITIDAQGTLFICDETPRLFVFRPCYPNCDGSTTTPLLTPNDFQCFLNRYSAGNPQANCDGSSSPPILTPNDFLCFLNAFAGGCS